MPPITSHTVTSNHIHLLVADDADRKTIPDSIKLVAGRTGQTKAKRQSPVRGSAVYRHVSGFIFVA
jgi:hypothetical protein